MNAQQLKASILQMAIQGKLAEQDPTDESASILLKRIQAEKQELINQGKIKEDENPSVIFRGEDNKFYEQIDKSAPVCIDDEIPFEIPESWSWIRLGTLLKIKSGKGLTSKEMKSGDIPVYGGNGITGYHNLQNVFKETVVIGRVGRYCGSIHVTPTNAWVTDNALITTYPEDHINRKYLVYCLRYMNLGKNNNATAQPVVSGKKIYPLLFPVPPLPEQRRIVTKIEELAPCIDLYDELQSTLSELDKVFPDQFRKSILQYAIQGKLVPQDPNDEPVEELLERIKIEKKKLIKEGKIKKDKNESVIYRRDNSYYEKLNGLERCIDDEIPFEIPDSWCWVRLGTISTYTQSKKKINAQKADKTMWELDLEHIEKGGEILAVKSVADCDAKGVKTFFNKGDILYSKLRPYLLKVLVAPDKGICTTEIVPFSLYGDINAEYIVSYLKSPYVDGLINSITYGIKMPRVSTETMASLLVPIPSVEEQRRIVTKIKDVLAAIKAL